MRIAIGGFMHESNTFAPLPANLARFREGSLTYGPALVHVWREAHHEVGGFIEAAAKLDFNLVPVAMASATPAGPVTDEFFEHMCDVLVTGYRMAKPDGVLIALHGAMVTPRFPAADADVLAPPAAASVLTCLWPRRSIFTAMSGPAWPTPPTSSSATRPTRTSTSEPEAVSQRNCCDEPC